MAKPAIAVASHACDQLDQVVPFLSQRIFHTRRNFGEGLSQHNPLFFQRTQALGKGFRADALKGPFQLIEAFDARRQIPDNEDSPLAADDPGRTRYRTGGVVGLVAV